jgi:DNA-binding NtrC family response regulator
MFCPRCGVVVTVSRGACARCGFTLPLGEGAPTTTIGGAREPSAASQSPRRALHVVASPGLPFDKHAVVALEGPIQVGRGADVALLDQKLSRVHCAVFPLTRPAAQSARPIDQTNLVGGISGLDTRRASEHAVRDLASRNGTFLNGRRIVEERLHLGDVIRVGDSLLVYAKAASAGASLREPLVGVSADMLELGRTIARIAPTDLTVLVEGPTGTGKEVVARALHAASARKGDLLAINAAAVPHALFESEVFGHVRGAFTGAVSDQRGLFVSASGGSLFLDEIGELPLDLQAKLLRVLETRSVRAVGSTKEVPVDVRIIAATNAPLRKAVERGTFRGDLYARLSEANLSLPALRERPEDVRPLAFAFLREAVETGPLPDLSPDFLEALLRYAWPFNVRELRSLIRRLGALHGERALWGLELLPKEMWLRDAEASQAAEPPKLSSDAVFPNERELRELLVRHEGNVKEVASALGKGRTQIYRWLQRYGLRPESFRRR